MSALIDQEIEISPYDTGYGRGSGGLGGTAWVKVEKGIKKDYCCKPHLYLN